MELDEVQPQRMDKTQRTILIVAAAGAVLLVTLFIYISTRPARPQVIVVERLEGGVRIGTPEFDAAMSKIVMDPPEATQSIVALNGIRMDLHTVVRNFTGKRLTGLEVTGIVVDINKRPIRERVLVFIPNRFSPLENNKTLLVDVPMEGFKDTDDRANIEMKITAVKVE